MMNNSAHYPQFTPLGDQCLLVRFGHCISEEVNQLVINFARSVVDEDIEGIVEVVPAYAEVAVYYNALYISYSEVLTFLKKLSVTNMPEVGYQRKIVRIPVCYGGEFGPDIKHVADHNGITVDDVIKIHSAAVYPVYMLGFTPGFCYLGDMSDSISCPRKERPRLSVPAGSVGIAGGQTGIYPLETPGGWQLIGQTPLELFDAQREPKVLVRAGDAIQFHAINQAEFDEVGSTQEGGRDV